MNKNRRLLLGLGIMIFLVLSLNTIAVSCNNDSKNSKTELMQLKQIKLINKNAINKDFARINIANRYII